MRIIETNDDVDEDATLSNNNKGAPSSDDDVLIVLLLLLLSRSIEMMRVKAWFLRVFVYTFCGFYSAAKTKERVLKKKLFRVYVNPKYFWLRRPDAKMEKKREKERTNEGKTCLGARNALLWWQSCSL